MADPIIDINTPNAPVTASTTSARVQLARTDEPYITAYNAGTTLAFVRCGDSDVIATTTDFPVAPNAYMSFQKDPDFNYAAAILVSGTATVYFMAGKGE